MRASLRPSRVKGADFAFFATPDYRAKSVAFKPLSERNTGLWPVRPAAILTADFQRSLSGVELRWAHRLWESVFLPTHVVAVSPLSHRIRQRMTKPQTGIANPAVIDLFGVDQKTGEVLLVMNEPRPWHGGHEHLHEMQEKFNAYASFILDGEMTEAHPELAGRTARIQLRCEYMPGKEALALLQAIRDQLELQAIRVEVVVTARSCDDQCGCHPEGM